MTSCIIEKLNISQDHIALLCYQFQVIILGFTNSYLYAMQMESCNILQNEN